jgi:hypothetical protein
MTASRQFVSLGAKPDAPPWVKVRDENVSGWFCLEKHAKLGKRRLHSDSGIAERLRPVPADKCDETYFEAVIY